MIAAHCSRRAADFEVSGVGQLPSTAKPSFAGRGVSTFGLTYLLGGIRSHPAKLALYPSKSMPPLSLSPSWSGSLPAALIGWLGVAAAFG